MSLLSTSNSRVKNYNSTTEPLRSPSSSAYAGLSATRAEESGLKSAREQSKTSDDPRIEEYLSMPNDDDQSRLEMEKLSLLAAGGYGRIPTGVSLTWKNINYTVGPKEAPKTILNNISGYVRPGQVLVILGPSGSGKTSLLSILSGTRPHTSGDIFYQGRKKTMTTGSDDIMGFGGNASYVTQDDLLMGSLSLEQTLRYAAQLKINDASVDKEARIDAIISYLGLESARNTLVGSTFIKGLSGGQKRRLSIGVELVTQPGLLFLDEVTSGLDATSAYKLVRLISKLANLGHSVIMTLHQPTSRIFQVMCHHEHYLMILEQGNMSYFGLARDSLNFFDEIGFPVPPLTNATDYFLDLVNRDFEADKPIKPFKPVLDATTTTTTAGSRSGGAIGDLLGSGPEVYTSSSQRRQQKKSVSSTADYIHNEFMRRRLASVMANIEEIGSAALRSGEAPKHLGVNKLVQLGVLVKRNQFNLLRNPGIFWLRAVMYLAMSLALGSMYWDLGKGYETTQDRIIFIFFFMGFFSFMSISAMPAFVEERSVFLRERMNNHYNTLSYVIADFVSCLPWIAALAIVCCGITYSMVHMRWGWDYFWIFLLDFFLTLVVAENLMVAISAVSTHFMVGLAAGAGLLGIYMMLAGFAMKEENMPDGWKWGYHALSFQNYSFRIFMYNEFHNNYNIDIGATNDGNEILKSYSMKHVDIERDMLIIVAMIFVYRILFYFLLKFRNRRQK